MSREDPQMKIRLPAEMKEQLEKAATENKRSMNAEVLSRLKDSFKMDSLSEYAKATFRRDLIFSEFRKLDPESADMFGWTVALRENTELLNQLNRILKEKYDDPDIQVEPDGTVPWSGAKLKKKPFAK